jgi:hypothetical protein
MPLHWKVIAVHPEEAQEIGTGTWEPFALSEDEEGNEVILCKGLVEVEGEKSSVTEGTLAEFPD